MTETTPDTTSASGSGSGSGSGSASTWDRRYLFLAIPLAILVAPIALMLIASPIVAVWVGLHSLLGLDLPGELDSLLPLGPLGDVFGGLLGPLLNALVLGATIWIALSQGKRASKELAVAKTRFESEQKLVTDDLVAAEKRFDAEQKQIADDAKFARANGVVAWVAETPRDENGKSHLGVVVTNNSGSLVRDLDLVVTVTSSAAPSRRNREAVVPPGSWFLQLDRPTDDDEEAPDDSEKAPDLDGGWPAPVPVDAAGHMRVSLPATDKGGKSDTEYALRVHPPELNAGGFPLPYFEVDELQFELAGDRWRRNKNGTLAHCELDDLWFARFEPLAKTPRPTAKGPKQVHQKNDVVQERIRRVAATLTGRSADEVVWDQRYPVIEELRAVGLVQLRVTTGGQAISFYSSSTQEKNEGVVWMAGRNAEDIIPWMLKFTGEWATTRAPSMAPLRAELRGLSEQPEELARVFAAKLGDYRQ